MQCRHCRKKWRSQEVPISEFHSGRLFGDGSSSDTKNLELPPSGSSSSLTIDTCWAGRRLGRYQIMSVLGTGGMAVVWRAHDDSLRRDTALKILTQRGSRSGNGGGLNAELFMQEARAIARLQHPAVVAIFEVGQDAGQVFLAIELMEGGTLKEWVERYGRIPPRELWAQMVGPARALALAHRRGIIHRDIKPSNLMFDDLGHMKLMDFGLADVAQEMVSKRMRGKTVGSMGWIAPETARGEGTTASSDIYSMGLAMLFALTGNPWLRAHSRGELMALHRNPPAVDLNGIKGLTPGGAAILKTCLTVEQSDRYLTADHLADALQECADERPSELSRRRKSSAALAAAAFIIGGLIVLAGGLHIFNRFYDAESKFRQPVAKHLLHPPSTEAVPGRAPGLDSDAAVAEPGADTPSTAVTQEDEKRGGPTDLHRPWPEVFGNIEFKFVGAKKGGLFHKGSSACGRDIYASNLVWFESVDEALDSGRKPCPECRPTGGRAIGIAAGPESD